MWTFKGIRDSRVLQAFERVPRESFVPDDQRRYAREDRALPIGFGQTISQPYIVAVMSEQLALTGTEKVLEVGTGCGYQTAILAELAAEVFTVEILPDLACRAKERLQRLGYGRVHFLLGDGALGWSEHAPYDAILAACAPERVPEPLLEQLKDGGRLVIPLGSPRHTQLLFLIRKIGTGIDQKPLMPVAFVPMTTHAAA